MDISNLLDNRIYNINELILDINILIINVNIFDIQHLYGKK